MDVAIASEGRFRGVPVSEGRPVAQLDLSYDDAAGSYLGGDISVRSPGSDDAALNGWTGYAGYAHRFGSGLIVDAGLAVRHYDRALALGYSRTFGEAYVGLAGRAFGTHLFVSPDYDGNGGRSLYWETGGTLLRRGPVSINGTLGLLAAPRGWWEKQARLRPNWELSAVLRHGRVSFSASYVGSRHNYERRRARDALLVGASCSF